MTLLLRLRDRADSMSWREFHERYGQLLYRYARARGAGHADAEDVVQEVELGLFKAMDRFEYDARRGRFRAYLRAAVVHTLSRRADRQNRQPPALDPKDLDYVSAESAASADARWELEWQQNRLRWAMRIVAAEFEAPTMRAFELHVLAGQPVDRVATEMGISVSSVYQAKSRILKRLREHLAQVDPDGDL